MPDRWRGLEVFFAGIVAFFTIVLAVVSYYQWDVANKSVSAAKDSAAAAKTAAQSAQTANQLSQQSLVITESPYVYNKRFVLKPLKVGQKATVTIEFENMGKLAAENFSEGANVELRTSPPIVVNLGASIKPTQLVPLVPKTLAFSTTDPINTDQMRAIRSGALTLFVYGALRYQTILVPNGLTITTFCGSYDPRRGLELIGCDNAPQLMINGQLMQSPANPKLGP